MKRAILLLLTVLLIAAASTTAPAQARSCAINCNEARFQCADMCEADLCTEAFFICNDSDPCDYSCRCAKCLP